MNERDLQHILYISKYCQMIADSIRRFGFEYERFENDYDYFNSVSMSIMQIGEHAKSLSQIFTDSTSDKVPWHAIRGIRNMFAHEYIVMDKSRVWATACNDIPKLLQFCDEMLEATNFHQERNTEKKASIVERLRNNKNNLPKYSPSKGQEIKEKEPDI